jgi:hypothetical protein
METLTSGAKAYLDSFTGLIPCKVLSIVGNSTPFASSTHCVTVEITGNGRAYKKGQQETTNSIRVIPRKAIRRRKYSTTIRLYKVQCDSQELSK